LLVIHSKKGIKIIKKGRRKEKRREKERKERKKEEWIGYITIFKNLQQKYKVEVIEVAMHHEGECMDVGVAIVKV